jgi:cytochrome c-type biogenesis protein CcmF
MIDIGYFALCLALVAAGCAAVFSAAGAHRQHLPLIRSGENAALAFTGLLTLAVLALWHALFTHNFEVQFVAENSNRDMPTLYVVSALWGGQSGSLLFWVWLLSLFTAAAILFNRHRHRALMPYVVMTLSITCFFFVLLNLFAADPFKKMPFVPADGRGLNPLLQHPLMAIHPPLLYLGMVGMSVPFAFGIAALITRQLDSAWLLAARRWMLIPWTFLGAGLLLGGKWAYVELGWGGYWGWDPVENSSLIPWLAGTAFLHSIMIQERRGMLKVWNMVLVILTYCLCIFGTFLTRSGIVSSVHAFAKSNVGPFFVVFLGLSILASSLLLLSRLPQLRAESRLESFISRETAFLLNNWILLGILFAVMWGTLFPVISEALTDEKITVGPPFFNQVNVPIGLVLLFLTGAGPLFAWRRTSTQSLKRNFALPLGAALPAALLLLVAGVRDVYALVCLSLCAFVAASIALEFHRGAGARRHSTGEPYPQALYRLLNKSRRRYGGYLVHLAMVLLFVGFAGQAFTTDKEIILRRGETAHVAGYTLQYGDLVQTQDANMAVTAASLELSRQGEFVGTLLPARNFYRTHDQATTEVSIYSSLREDFYLILVGISDDGSAKFQIYINPLVNWVWAGGILFVLASLWSMWPTARERRMAALERASAQEPGFLFGQGAAPSHA